MKQIRVHFKAKTHLYIHNDISNAAHYLKKRINERIEKNDRRPSP